MSTLKFNQWLNSDNTENYKCRAWVTFNGGGTVAVIAGGNVSSVTDLAVGRYSVNFTSAFSDANYSTVFSADLGTDGAAYSQGVNTTTAIAELRSWRNDNGALLDASRYYVAVFR